ncbi:MAG: pyrroline-5-carboxylate reductase [Gammaproteobacteria bacterium]|nr:MAG: pyrroline-5-carboxylate reductase [Gammaproteobacteria bacterium]
MPKIGFVGGGNMAGSLIGGLINSGHLATDIIINEPDETKGKALTAEFSVCTGVDINILDECEIIVLAVKPQILRTVCLQLAKRPTDNRLFISIAAGVKSTDIDRWLSQNDTSQQQAIVRCMPNTPALLQCGASGLFANESVTDTQKQQAENVLNAVGLVIWVENEDLLNAVTAVSGSGPAYFFLLMEAMQKAGEKLGLTTDIAQQLVLQTALGAARMATESDTPPADLRKNVTSKGGTTEQAILSFQSADFQEIVFQALKAANDRSISLADELGSE